MVAKVLLTRETTMFKHREFYRVLFYRTKILFLLVLIANLVSCSGSSSDSTQETDDIGLFANHSVVFEGLTRSYDYYIPNNLGSSPRPLIILLHGGGSRSEDLTGTSGFKAPYTVWMDIAEEEKLILLYPDGALNSEGGQGWNDCRADTDTNPTTNDVGFISALIDEFAMSFDIDINRIYVSGSSNGGLMSLRLAQELSDKVAAVAPVLGAIPAVNECAAPTHPISVLLMNGTSDTRLPYNGGVINAVAGNRGTILSTQESIEFWIGFNQTNLSPVVQDFEDVNGLDQSTVKSFTYTGGIEDTEVVLYKISGGGHVEPSILEQYSLLLELSLGKQNHDIEMAREVWKFFKDKKLGIL